MNDHASPEKTLFGFLKFTYWELPKTVFGRWTLFWMYLLPAIFFVFWQEDEQFRIAKLPIFEELIIVEGKAEFASTRRKSLLIRRSDGSLYVPICRPLSMGSRAGCAHSMQLAEKLIGRPARAWIHPVAGAMKIEVDGVVQEGFDFKSLSQSAIDTSTLDIQKFVVQCYFLCVFLMLPLFALKKFFNKGE